MAPRCKLLATFVGMGAFRCPSGKRVGTKFHYHGTDDRQPYNLMVRGKLCTHHHQNLTAAQACARLNAPSLIG